jgi:cytochrome c oxidase cbb3-type subunit 3
MHAARLAAPLLVLTLWSSNDTLAALAEGSVLYQQHCAVCHGAQGDGGVGVPLNLPDFLEVASDEYLRRTLRQGRPGRVMPAFTTFDDETIDALIGYIRSWADQPAPRYSSASLAGNAERGARLYDDHCKECHGDSGQGGTGTGVTFSRPRGADIMAPALNNRGFQASVSDAMLKATLLRGRRGTPMPALESLGLEASDVDDIVGYLRQLGAEAADSHTHDGENVIEGESAYDFEQTVENLKLAIVGRNFRVIREQFYEQGLVPEGEQNQRQTILYFCNFAFLNEALAVDPRVGLFLPCRVTVVETPQGVKLMSINPMSLSRLFNNVELDRVCEKLLAAYTDIIEDASL